MDGRPTEAPSGVSPDLPSGGAPRATAPSASEHYLAAELFERMHSTRELVAFLENGSLDGMWIWDLDRPENVWMTHRFRELLGFGDTDLSEAAFINDRVDPADAIKADAAFRRHLADPSEPYDQILRYRHRDGSTVWVRSRGFALRDADGRPTRFVGVHTDLTRTMAAQQALAASLESVEAYSGMLEHLDRITVSLHELTEPHEVVESLVRILGQEIGELSAVFLADAVSRPVSMVAVDSDDPVRIELMRGIMSRAHDVDDSKGPVAHTLRTGEEVLYSPVDGPTLVRMVDDTARTLVAGQLPTSMITLPWRDPDGSLAGAVLVARFDPSGPPLVDRDLTLIRQIVERHASAHRQLQTQLETRAVSRFRELARSAPMAIVQIDAEGSCTFLNDQWMTLTGRSEEQGLDHGWVGVFRDEDLASMRAAWIPARTNGEVLKLETRIHHADGRELWVGGSAVAQFDDDGTYSGALIALSDVTARKRAEAELTHRARIDPLTGAANRYALFERIDDALRDVKRRDAVLGLIYLDLDTFKEVNDSLGHEIGDHLLVSVAERLRGVLRDSDSCARVGGDEFVLLLADVGDRFEAARVAQRVRSLLCPPFEVSGVTLHTSASMGVVTICSDDGVLRADEVLRRADRAMYRAKAAGRDRWESFELSMDEQARSEAALRQEIADAISSGHLVLHYQPIVDLQTMQMVGVEALVRILHPTRGLLPPAQFLDVAERSGQIVAVGEWVVREACRRLARWHELRADLYLTLNLSGRQIADAGVSDLVLDAVAEHSISPDRLVVEVTETTLVKAVGNAALAIERIRGAGVRIAIDDFGTGYSSLARLTEIPADMIKIDRSFVASAASDPMNAAVISAVVHLADRVDLDVVAEGVETEEQLRTIRELGCRVGQGFLFSRPLPDAALEELLQGAFVTHGGAAADFRA